MTDAPAYGQVLGRNISAARGRLQLPQSALAERMRALGFPWKQQTVAVVEKGIRRATAEEILGLALALETTIAALMSARDQSEDVRLPSGLAIGAVSVERLAGRGVNDRTVRWSGTEVTLVARFRYPPGTDPFDEDQFTVPPSIEAKLAVAARPPVVADESHDDHGT